MKIDLNSPLNSLHIPFLEIWLEDIFHIPGQKLEQFFHSPHKPINTIQELMDRSGLPFEKTRQLLRELQQDTKNLWLHLHLMPAKIKQEKNYWIYETSTYEDLGGLWTQVHEINFNILAEAFLKNPHFNIIFALDSFNSSLSRALQYRRHLKTTKIYAYKQS